MNKKLIISVFSFIVVFLLIFPVHADCQVNKCFELAFLLSFIFSWAKANEYDFLKGDAFYGLYIYGTKINPLNKDSSSQHKIYRYFWFLSLILADIGVIFYIVKFSWLFN